MIAENRAEGAINVFDVRINNDRAAGLERQSAFLQQFHIADVFQAVFLVDRTERLNIRMQFFCRSEDGLRGIDALCFPVCNVFVKLQHVASTDHFIRSYGSRVAP